jgi:predicted lipoprotein with Yx(FWY)xxD motif
MIRTRNFHSLAAAAAIALSGLAVAACGSTSSSTTKQTNTGTGSAAAPAQSADPSSATVDLASSTLGTILVNSQGRTLYLFKADTGTKSACTGACAAAWPPLVSTGKPRAGNGVQQSLLGTSKRADGTEQVSYDGHPLYLFTGDTASGQTNGQGSTGFGALWFVLSPAGSQITASSSSSGGRSTTSGY